ncbi:DNA polymerase ligase N-terminal domain-containing protein [Streptomyces sp. TS71-3]|uniref:DNA polymerase ligase N-terminal domain-containing protein n=1 Tax=Streptomyces sp. TS71-3 TaxID=2733862 RepID=UPI001B2A921B|nr:DNA polymerase ligase N-terminal domain-containing protein [Streptomyces sp. TS71-3]GHJ42514.1 3'-phosphoesterase [Streptomyces sp. TS71-3]
MAEQRKRESTGSGGTLRTYRAKRHFDRTAEPRGSAEEGGEHPLFVVQIHDASTMHFDFRLEVDGVLKSWSVPKGPSSDPHDKRLAMPTEDHPLEYRDFEGVIPAGEYGGGTVIVWDDGTYRPLSHDRRGRPVPFGEALRKGHASFRLEGSKLRGGYALTRIRGGDGSEREAWLLVKEDDRLARQHGGPPDPRRARSARSGRTLRQVAEHPEAEWRSDRS